MKSLVDYMVSVFSPAAGARRLHARKVERSYKGGEPNRLTAHQKPKNQSADTEAHGPFGADSLRAWARMLVRDNPYAWAAKEAILSEVIGTGIVVQSDLETDAGQDEEDTNENRDKVWREWCEVCDLNGELTFDEIQVLAFGEMVEAGECMIRFHAVPKKHKGIHRPVPLAIELIEADRIATDHDSYALSRDRVDGIRVTRGVEMDQHGKVLAYWLYPAHPTEPNVYRRTAERVDAKEVQHLFKKDRIGQSRGVTWFHPIISLMRTLDTYVENEMQASAVASCYTTFVKTESPISQGLPRSGDSDTTDEKGSQYQFLEPGMILPLRPGESVESTNPGRPNVNAGPWINLMVRGFAAGTGTSYEGISKDFTQTSYSSSRTSKLENRPRYRRHQNYQKQHVCQRTWDEFCDAAARDGRKEFPSATELLDDRRKFAPIVCMPPRWEWVDIVAEQQSSESAIQAFQSTYAEELGGRGSNWRRTFKQRAKEEQLKNRLGLVTPEDAKVTGELSKETTADAAATTAEAQTGEEVETTAPTSEMSEISTLQFKRNRKAIEGVLAELAAGEITENKARVFLSSVGMQQESVDALIEDALDDGQVDLPEEVEA